MVARILTIIFILGIQSTNAETMQDIFRRGINEYQKGHFDQALRNFEQISSESKEFAPAIINSSKVLFVKERWEEFFAYAKFNRLSELKINNFDIINLEILALSKFCQYEVAKGIIEDLTQKKVLNEAQSRELNAHVGLSKESRKKVISPVTSRTSKYWRVNSNILTVIQHPKDVRVQVESRCQK